MGKESGGTHMILTSGQVAACDMVASMMQSPKPEFGIITGWAGCGKTTLLKTIAEKHGQPLVVTPTGKAALRVGEATGLEACTLHRWMYQPSEDPKTGEVRYQRKPLDQVELPENGLIVVDEASMLAEGLWLDLWSTASSVGLKVLLVGDPFQLPPIVDKGARAFQPLKDLHTEHRAELREVVRQALGSPIVRASLELRRGEEGAFAALRGLEAVHPADLVARFLAMPAGDRALIVHTNATRHRLNLEVRRALGRPDGVLQEGEPLLVLQNSYQLDRYNGEVVEFGGWDRAPGEPVAVRDRFSRSSAMLAFGSARVDGGAALLSEQEVFGSTHGVGARAIRREAHRVAVYDWGWNKESAPGHLNANLGYCLTGHKAQGSQWAGVLVVVEPTMRDPYGLEWRRWVYTSLTRAVDEVAVCCI